MNTLQRPVRHEHVVQYFEDAGRDYRAWSPAYNMHFGYWQRGINPFKLAPMLDAMTDQVYARLDIADSREPLVLDLGCGLGTASRYMADHHPNAQFIGVSITPWQVREGTRMTEDAGLEGRVMLIEADYLDLPYAPESADAAFAIESACYARGKDKWDFIQALHRLLRPGGRFAVADCFRCDAKPLPRLLERVYRRCCACWVLDEMAALPLFIRSLERSGFEQVQVDDISWHVAPSVAHVPKTVARFVAQSLWRGDHFLANAHRRNNVLGPALGMLLGMSRPYFRYCLVSGRKAAA